MAFRVLLTIVDFYTKQRSSFTIKEAVLRNPLIINADVDLLFGINARENRKEKLSIH